MVCGNFSCQCCWSTSYCFPASANVHGLYKQMQVCLADVAAITNQLCACLFQQMNVHGLCEQLQVCLTDVTAANQLPSCLSVFEQVYVNSFEFILLMLLIHFILLCCFSKCTWLTWTTASLSRRHRCPWSTSCSVPWWRCSWCRRGWPTSTPFSTSDSWPSTCEMPSRSRKRWAACLCMTVAISKTGLLTWEIPSQAYVFAKFVTVNEAGC